MGGKKLKLKRIKQCYSTNIYCSRTGTVLGPGHTTVKENTVPALVELSLVDKSRIISNWAKN
jgi:hypothetical protein